MLFLHMVHDIRIRPRTSRIHRLTPDNEALAVERISGVIQVLVVRETGLVRLAARVAFPPVSVPAGLRAESFFADAAFLFEGAVITVIGGG